MRGLCPCRAGATVACRSARRPRQRGLDKGIDVATEHSGPVVLHEGVRVEDVGADLTPPVRRAELAAFLRLRFFLLPHLPLEQPGTEDLHRRLLVLELRTLVLTGDD